MSAETFAMTPTLIIALVSLALSLISTCIAVVSFLRTRQVQNYDYATRLQLEDEDIQGNGQEDVFRYSANLVNLGIKPIQVDHIYVDYGGESDSSYSKFHVEGRFHLPPSGKRTIRFSLSRGDYEEVLKRFSLEQCLFRLRVCFLNTTGGTVETTRRLMALGPGKVTMYAQRGDAIT